MFDRDFFTEDPDTKPSRVGEIVGGIGDWGLHLAHTAFLIYSGYHGIAASWNYAGNSDIERVAQMAGIVVLEITLFSIYLAWHNQKVVGAAQSIAAGLTYAVGFVLACFGIVADSQLHAAVAMSPWLVSYLKWGLPIAPAIMALGAVLIHELAPTQLRKRDAVGELVKFAEEQFKGTLAGWRAEHQAAKTIKNMQLNAKSTAAEQIAAWYNSEHAQRAITSTAMQNAPALLRSIGVNVEDIPDSNNNGRFDLPDLLAHLQENPAIAQRVMRHIQGNGVTALAAESRPGDVDERPRPNG